MLQIFNARGEFDFSAVTEEAIAALSASQQQVLSVLIDAHGRREEAAAAHALAQKAARAAMENVAIKHAKYLEVARPQSFMEAREQALAAYNGRPLEPAAKKSHPKQAIAGPKKDWEAAEANLGEKRIAESRAKSAFVVAERALSEATITWVACNPAPDATSVAKDHLAKHDAIKMDRVAAGLPAVEKPLPVQPASPLDAQAMARGRSGTRVPLFSSTVRRSV
ncbi:hypothetical protein [Bradyrhizobium sp. USDA 4473]